MFTYGRTRDWVAARDEWTNLHQRAETLALDETYTVLRVSLPESLRGTTWQVGQDRKTFHGSHIYYPFLLAGEGAVERALAAMTSDPRAWVRMGLSKDRFINRITKSFEDSSFYRQDSLIAKGASHSEVIAVDRRVMSFLSSVETLSKIA